MEFHSCRDNYKEIALHEIKASCQRQTGITTVCERRKNEETRSHHSHFDYIERKCENREIHSFSQTVKFLVSGKTLVQLKQLNLTSVSRGQPRFHSWTAAVALNEITFFNPRSMTRGYPAINSRVQLLAFPFLSCDSPFPWSEGNWRDSWQLASKTRMLHLLSLPLWLHIFNTGCP